MTLLKIARKIYIYIYITTQRCTFILTYVFISTNSAINTNEI